jgi:uncharacterized protein
MSSLRFTWDETKAAANLSKHHISFEEALTVFADPLARIFTDDEHSSTDDEHSSDEREIIIGHTAKQRLIVVCFMEWKELSECSAPCEQAGKNGKIMKKTSAHSQAPESLDNMRREYRFDYRKAKPNRFAKRMAAGTIAVVLDPDVAVVFKSSQAVNNLLRLVIAAFPRTGERRPEP